MVCSKLKKNIMADVCHLHMHYAYTVHFLLVTERPGQETSGQEMSNWIKKGKVKKGLVKKRIVKKCRSGKVSQETSDQEMSMIPV